MGRLSSRSQKGRFIAFEGGEGAGKSTQAKLLSDALRGLGVSVDITREPGGTPGAEAIRDLLLNPPTDRKWRGWGARAEALLFAAARSDHVERRIRPALECGTWVICDRFVDSSRAYQGGAGGLGDESILSLHNFGSEGLRPDLTILLDVPADMLGKRLALRDGTGSDAIGGRDAAYHQKVASRFSVIAQSDKNRVVVIDGGRDPQDVHADVAKALNPMISEFIK